MQRLVLIGLLLLLPLSLTAKPDDQIAGTEWKGDGHGSGLIIYSRTREGSSLKEFKAVGTIAASSSAVFAVLNNAEAFPRFMPYTSECQVLKRTGTYAIVYQRLDLPLTSDRDYTLRCQSWRIPGPKGLGYRIHWESANDLGPAEKSDVQRVKVCEGSWLIEPDGEGATRATYSIYTDSGGALPAIIADCASRVAIGQLFAAIRKEVREPGYATAAN